MKPRTSLTNMNVFQRVATGSNILLISARQILACALASALLLPMLPQSVSAAQEQDAQAPAQSSQAPPYTQQTPDQLQQLVAPIALYPDSLVAQVLAASTFPAELVEADRWVQANPDLKGDALAQAVDKQSWDPSVKALTAFPTVLGNMDKNISWTSSLGDAYYNQEQGVMDAIQVMRQKAQQAGNLKDTQQQTVQTQGSTIVIQPAQPDVVYVPAYNPWLVYGYPVVAWPGWYPYPGIWFGGPYLNFGLGFGIGWWGGVGWGWGDWGFDWQTITPCLTVAGITPGAGRFTTGAVLIAAERREGAVSTVPVEGPGLSMETGRRLEDTLRRGVRAASDRVPSAATTTVERPGA